MNETPGLNIPLYQSLTQPILTGGVPGTFFTLNLMVGVILSIPLALPYIGVPVFIFVHGIAAWLTRKDVYFFEVLMRHLRQPQYWT